MQCNRICYRFKKYWHVQIKIKNCMSSIQTENEISKDQQLIEKNEHRSKITEATSGQKSNVISNYLDSKECLRQVKPKISEQFLKTISKPRSIFIIDSEVAEKLFKTLHPHLTSYSGHILEVNAGIGVLTKYLMDAKLPRLHIYEFDKMMHSHLYILKIQSGSDAVLIQENMLSIWAMTRKDQHDGKNRVGKMFEGLPILRWEDDPVLKMIVTIPNEYFLLHVMFCIIFQCGMCNYGRPQLFAIMPPYTYFNMAAQPADGARVYRSKPVLFDVLFEHTVLDTLDAKAFLPWLKKKKKQYIAKTRDFDTNSMYLVKITARRDLFQTIPPNLLKAFWFYLHTMMRSRSVTVVSFWEKWIPGSGVKLISQGYTMYTKCGQITPREHVKIFLEFSSLPEFKSCAFLPSMELLLLKMVDPGYAEEVMLANKTRDEPKVTKESDDLDQDDDSVDDLEHYEFYKSNLNYEEDKNR